MHPYIWSSRDNLILVANRFMVQANWTSVTDLAGAILQQNYPLIIDPVTAKQRADGSWTSGIRPGTQISIPYRS